MKVKRYIILILIINTFLFASSEKSNFYVDAAWKALGENNLQQAETYFVSAIEEHNNNIRAHLGLSYLYNLKSEYSKSWSAFEPILDIEENIYPYIYASWATDKMRDDDNYKRPYVIDLVKDISDEADRAGILKAMANEELGLYFQRKNDLSQANFYYSQMNAVLDWMLIGPFDNISASGYDKSYPPENEYDLSKSYIGKNGIPTNWFKIEAVRRDCWIDFRRYFSNNNSVFYANNFIYSPNKQLVQIRIGTSGSFKTFLNDEKIMEWFDESNNDLDTYIVETELQEGWNRLLIKCGFSEINSCNFMVRITNEFGEPCTGLKVSIDQKNYHPKPNASVKIIENFAELFFKNKIEKNPQFLENYLLLADCYLRNDKAIEAELILRKAIKLLPNCTLLLTHMLEAYRRGEKYDEYRTMVEKIFSLNKNIPLVLEHKISNSLEIEDFENADELLSYYRKIRPDSEETLEFEIRLCAQKKQYEQIYELNQRAYEMYSKYWYFTNLQVAIAIEAREYEMAIDILEEYLDQNIRPTVLKQLAETYLYTSDISSWEEVYMKLIEYDPAATGYYYDMVKTYFSLQEYDKAEESLHKVIKLAPFMSTYWESLGYVKRAQNNIEDSREAFVKALKYRPTNYNARLALRELDGQGEIFSEFDNIRIDEYLENTPDQNEYPNDGAVILLDDTKRVVYNEGASEVLCENVVKVFNANGIDAFNEYWIDYNSYSQILTVEKAVVIKPDGSEIKADIDDNYIVFKSLVPNDLIYMKWKIRNYYSGKLSNEFWDMSYFCDFFPVKHKTYSLLLPKDFEFNFVAQNMDIEPIKIDTKVGTIWQWKNYDEPAAKYEYEMPLLDDVGKVLFISSIENWGTICDWYADITGTKARSSFEIKEQVDSLFRGQENLGEWRKVEIIYNYINENIRYSSVSFRQSNYIPQKARNVLVNKIGDCKDVSTLAISMLKEVGIESFYVLLNTRDYGLNKNILPSVAFNHVIVGIETENGLKFLDFAASNYPSGTVPESDKESFILAIIPDLDQPGYLWRDFFAPANVFRKCNIEIFEDNSISLQSNSIRTGSLCGSIRELFRHESQSEREKILSEGLSAHYPNLKVTKLDFENLDDLENELTLNYSYKIANYISEAGQFKIFKVPWEFIFTTRSALSYEERIYPYNYLPELDTLVEEFHVALPKDYEPVELVSDVNLNSSIADYSINSSFSKGILKIKKKLVNKKMVVSPKEYLEFKDFYNKLLKEDNKQILITKK